MAKAPKGPGASHRWHYDELQIAVVCPSCQLYMGQCRTPETRDTALNTHDRHCPKRESTP